MKSIRVTSLALLVVGALGADLACGGSSGKRGVREAVTGVRGPDGGAATFHEGPLPAPMGTIDVAVPSTNTAINGGSTMIAVSSTTEIVKIYVSVQGSDGYWEVTVPAGTKYWSSTMNRSPGTRSIAGNRLNFSSMSHFARCS